MIGFSPRNAGWKYWDETAGVRNLAQIYTTVVSNWRQGYSSIWE